MTPDPDLFLADMADLRANIEQLLFSAEADEAEDLAAAQADVLATLESCAAIYTGLIASTLKAQREATRRMGMREIAIPASFSGLWTVLPEKARPVL